MIPRIDFRKLEAGNADTLREVASGAREVGFLLLENTPVTAEQQRAVLAAYRQFFRQDPALKAEVDMARTGANRGWGASRSERVDPVANPDYKEVFDCGVPLSADDPLSSLPVYSENLWPRSPADFQVTVEDYFIRARQVAMTMLRGIARGIGRDPDAFTDKFARPMALLRGNYYPPRPAWAGDRDFGIATHTDYGCLTLLATDGRGGLEVELRDGRWHGVHTEPGAFVINFGEMLEMWSAGAVKATPHRVIGGTEERISAPLFFNPDYEANVAPPGSGRSISAGEHLSQRYAETYLHMGNG
ncbi:isopenicillin N synthase family dioxygenase [Spiribacter onubensis]|uniref:2-oxoglutarate-dependent ethylene/succinate-forming enzyme n=1 Tax=Spiribacter onubensis TaxID=3122420 RepID=A0ABV3S6R7_9GAMM